jgi:hypothetical protein
MHPLFVCGVKSPMFSEAIGSIPGPIVVFRTMALGMFTLAQTRQAPVVVRDISNLPHHNVFVVAHEDDWQLFMGDAAVKILKVGTPATFVYLTAGDDGRDSVYWRTRELAALKSTLVAKEVANTAADIKCLAVTVMGHAVRRCSLGNIDSYFFRLPDGKRNGSGFARYDHESIRSLRAKRIQAITTVDGTATYRGWADLVSTVNALINSGGAGILVHTMDPSIAANPHDHFDHRIAGLLVEELRLRRSFAARYYTGYALASRAANRSSEQTRIKTAVFLAYDSEMTQINKSWSAYKEHPAFYSQCMQRTYARTPRPR